MLSLLLAIAVSQPPKDNPLFKAMLDPGILIGKDIRGKLQAPNMPDGLTKEKQVEVIRRLISDDYTFEEFTRKSVVAPQLFKIKSIYPSDPKAPARSLDVWFIGHGDFKATDDVKFVERVVNAGREGSSGKGRVLTSDELAKRKIMLTPDEEKHERYASFEGDFIEKVRIQGVGRMVWSKGPESVIVASEIDGRFVNDAEFPNQWSSIIKEGGRVKLGAPQAYSGAGFYMKITKLIEPAGAMFFELHVGFTEPNGWFDRTPLLSAKDINLIIKKCSHCHSVHD